MEHYTLLSQYLKGEIRQKINLLDEIDLTHDGGLIAVTRWATLKEVEDLIEGYEVKSKPTNNESKFI